MRRDLWNPLSEVLHARLCRPPRSREADSRGRLRRPRRLRVADSRPRPPRRSAVPRPLTAFLGAGVVAVFSAVRPVGFFGVSRISPLASRKNSHYSPRARKFSVLPTENLSDGRSGCASEGPCPKHKSRQSCVSGFQRANAGFHFGDPKRAEANMLGHYLPRGGFCD